MKILVLAPSFASYSFFEAMLQALVHEGWEVHFACSNFNFAENSKSVPADIKVHDIAFPRGANLVKHLAAAKSLNALVNKIQPDLIDVHFSAAMLTAALGQRASWPPTLATIQGLRFPTQQGLRGRIERFVECWSAKRMYQCSVLTKDDFAALSSAGVDNASLQQASGFGCDLERFNVESISAEVIAQAKADAGVSEGDINFIFVGRKTAFKGFHKTVQAFFIAQKIVPEMRLIVCGNDDPIHSDGLSADERTQYQQHPRISDMGWENNVARFLALSYANVFPSKREGMPVNLMESLSIGVPVITLNSRGCRDVVQHKTTGLVLDSDEPAVIADAMVELARQPELRSQLSKCALDQREHFNRKNFVSERLSFFSSVVESDR